MFAALMVIRMREAIFGNGDGVAANDLRRRASWLSDDDVSPLELPLARATERVLASMHEVLTRTREGMAEVVAKTTAEMAGPDRRDRKTIHLVHSKAAELRLVRYLECLRAPAIEFHVKAMDSI